MNITSLGIKGKLLLIVGISILLLCGQAFFANRVTDTLIGNVEYFGNQRLPLTEAISDMRAATNAAPRFMWLALAFYNNKTDKQKYIEKIKEYMDMLTKSTETAGTYEMTDVAKAKLSEIKESSTKLFDELNKGIALLEAENKEAEAKEHLMTKMPVVALKTTTVIRELAANVTSKNKTVVIEAQANAKKSQSFLLVFSFICGGLLSAFGFLFANSLAKQLLLITEEVATASTQVASASEQLSRTSESLASALQEQASSIEETSSSLTEIMGMVESNIKSAENSNSVANQVHSMSHETSSFMESLSEAMQTILESNTRIEKLVKVIEEIGEKTEVIDDIVFKTQLLSFNASVEAERAGEHGRGFAVVAQEVGNLAQMSGKAATEISSIVKISIKEAETVARENKSRVENGGNLALETKSKMVEVSKRISEILNGTSQIVIASKEQGEGVNQINQSVDNLNKATQETASTAEESSSASAELASQSGTLMDLVSEMRHIVLGATANAKGQTQHSRNNKHQSEPHFRKNVISFEKKKGPLLNTKQNTKQNTKLSVTKTQKVAGAGNELVTSDVPSHTDEAWEKI